MKDFFISYNQADRKWAEWIAWQLKEAGHTVTVQAWDFRPGSNFVVEMHRAASEAERTIAVLSPDYLKSKYTQQEMAAALARDPLGEEGALLPVRVRKCDIEGLLGPIVYIDLIELDEAVAKQTLLDGVRRESNSPQQAPVFPVSQSQTSLSKPRFPGALPEICNLPHLRNPNFTGREAELAELRASLRAGNAAALVQPRAIHGLGGVGKTQLAAEYVYRNSADYEIAWWVRSEDPTTLASDYASLAAKLNLREKDATEQRVIVEAVKDWLQQHQGWLLVFDNAEDMKSVRPYIPRGNTSQIIITSRNASWRGVAKSLSVKTLSEAEAVDFLIKRTGHQDETTAKTLAEQLGYLPLALEQAGAYIDERRCTMARYLEWFEKRQREMLEAGHLSSEYPDTVATTWSLSFQNVEHENSAAAELLRLCAFFAPDDIPLKMLTDGAEEMPESLSATAADELLLNEALMALGRYSLVEVDNETLTIHRLVQAVIRLTMNDAAFKQWAGVAVHVVSTSYPNDGYDVRTWPICEPLLPHASTALSHADAVQFTSPETARLLNEMGVYLYARAEYAQAKRMLERALAIDEAAFGPNHPKVALQLNNLGLVLKVQGDLTGAKALYERALAIDEAAYGPNHPEVATDLDNLGRVLIEQGDLASAKTLYEQALRIFRGFLGDDHPSTKRTQENLRLLEEKLRKTKP